MGLALFLASLAVLFAATIVAYLAVRMDAPDWPPPGMPGYPPLLWGSTLIMLASSVSMHWALRGARSGDERALRVGMSLTTALAVAFLGTQILSWNSLAEVNVTVGRNLYAFTFYMLTTLHALHVVCGLIPLLLTTSRAFKGRYGPESSMGVLLCAMYWHFLDAVWLVLFAVLMLST